MFEFLLKLTHKKPCKKEKPCCEQKQEQIPAETQVKIPEEIVAKINYKELADAIVEANERIELDKAKKEEEIFKEKNINIYKILRSCIKIILFSISFLSLLIGLSSISLFFGISPSEFQWNFTVLFFSIIFLVITFVIDRINLQISDIKSKSEIKDIFNSLVAFAGMGLIIIETQIKQMIAICLNELLINPAYLIGVLIYIAIVTAEYIHKNKKEK